jgi:hypothetical protein
MFRHPVKISRQSTTEVEEAEKPEPEHKERDTTVLNFTERLGLTKPGVKVSEDIDSNEKQAATTTQ